jgi:hypothetical protein
MPSAFGKNNRRFDELHDVLIEDKDDYYNVIARYMECKMNIKEGVKLAVLVFFESV